MYIYVHVCIFKKCVYIYIDTCIYTCIHICLRVYIYIYCLDPCGLKASLSTPRKGQRGRLLQPPAMPRWPGAHPGASSGVSRKPCCSLLKDSLKGDIGPYKGHSRLHRESFGLRDFLRSLSILRYGLWNQSIGSMSNFWA